MGNEWAPEPEGMKGGSGVQEGLAVKCLGLSKPALALR
jgi:hypothetical protein